MPADDDIVDGHCRGDCKTIHDRSGNTGVPGKEANVGLGGIISGGKPVGGCPRDPFCRDGELEWSFVRNFLLPSMLLTELRLGLVTVTTGADAARSVPVDDAELVGVMLTPPLFGARLTFLGVANSGDNAVSSKMLDDASGPSGLIDTPI